MPGEENTVPDPFWPLGRHMLRLFVSSPATQAEHRRGSTPAFRRERGGSGPPSWPGNLGTGRWTPLHLCEISGFRLIEVRNLHSDENLDTSIWHSVLTQRMPNHPVWAVRSTMRCADEAGHGWIEIKVPEITGEAFREALIAGRFYATTGPECAFWVRGSAICARTARPSVIRFINREGIVVQTTSDAQKRNTFLRLAMGLSWWRWWIRMGREDGRSRSRLLPCPSEWRPSIPSCTEGNPGPA